MTRTEAGSALHEAALLLLNQRGQNHKDPRLYMNAINEVMQTTAVSVGRVYLGELSPAWRGA